MALPAYRHVLRAIRIAFQDDVRMLDAARREARQKFQQGRSLSAGSKEAAEGIDHAEGVAIVLRQNIVQGAADPAQQDRFRLRIHKDTEKGDNDSIKKGDGQGTLLDGAWCER